MTEHPKRGTFDSSLFPGCGTPIAAGWGPRGGTTTCGDHGVCGACWTRREIEKIIRRRVAVDVPLESPNQAFTFDDNWLRATVDEIAKVGG